MSDKNVHQLQWKQKNSEQSIYASRNANIQSTSPIANQQSTAAASASIHPSHSGTASNGRYPIIGSQPQVVTSPSSSTSSTNTSIGLQQHFHTMQHLQQQQQQQQQQQHHHQQQQQQHNHPHQQNPHFELSKIMAMNSGALSRLELPPALGNHPVSSAITENVLSLIGSMSSSVNSSNANSDDNKIPDEEKLRRVQAIVESGIGDHAKQQILQILDRISTLKPVERLLLYLRMPGETPESDPLRQPQNPLGTRSEINHTINWVRSHLEHDPKVSIPKQDVYNDYIAYCERLDIKPLSTADFGKVMKQVFPEIRPRRLGTRGHSRYCYAAMRKTTKLTPPQLPTIGGRTVDTVSSCEIECDPDADSWSTVRTWAEGLLNAKFDSLKDLAEHIGKNEYLGGGAGSSRVLLQKKLLQRDAKEKRVYADSGPLKKRRKKKRKGSTSSESSSTTQQAPLNEPTRSNEDILLGVQTIKQEILDSPNSQQSRLPQMHLHQPAAPYDSQMHGHQLLPMNLATENERSKSLGGLQPINSPVAKNLSKTIADLPPSVSLLPIDSQTAQLASVKEEIINDEYNPQNVICKKVRRAHLTKGILPTNNPPSSTITTAEAMPAAPHVPHVELSPADVSNYPMGPPAQITTTAMESAKLASQVRARKLRLLQAHNEMYQTYDAQQQQQQQAHIQQAPPLMDNVEITEDKDVVLPENLGLPRERVISICNMDKHELDDYLNANDEDNSQDQEAELIQYFQTGDAENNINNNNNKAMLQQQQQHQQQQQQQTIDAHNPTLAEYNPNSAFQVNSNNNSNKKKSMIGTAGGCYTRDREDITQLRNYLHQNFNKDSNESMGALAAATATLNQRTNVQGQKFQPNGNHYIMPGVYNEGSASASLAIMSQKHLNETASPSIVIPAAAAASISITTTTTTASVGNAGLRVNHSILPVDDYTPVPSNMRATQKRKINLNAMVPAPSTTQRRKNCTFFPISPNINLTNQTTNNSNSSSVSCTSSVSATTNANLFASPRLTASLVRSKPTLHKQQSLPAADKSTISSANDPMIGANRNSRNYSTITSASAPPSPSILQDTMMFGKNYNTANPMSGYTPLLSNQDYQQAFANTHKMLTNDQNSLESVLDEPPSHLMAESRSRSVPLQYCNSPAFNQTANYAGFSSTCNSAAQTPVPPQFADFSDPSSILDIFSDASQTHGSAIKMDDSAGGLLCGSVADILPSEYGRIPANSFGTIASRSVPSTPLPLHNMIDPFLGNSNCKKHHQKHDNFPSAQSKYSTKMYDISKSMPTTPITSNTATPSFRYSPEFNRDFLINGNTVESTPAYSRAPSVAGATAPSLSDSLLDDAREGGSNSLTDGMDDLGSFGEVSESIIEADILNMNNL